MSDDDKKPHIRIGIASAPVIITNLPADMAERIGKTIADRTQLFLNLQLDSLELYFIQQGIKFERIPDDELSETLKITQADIRMDLKDEAGRKRTN